MRCFFLLPCMPSNLWSRVRHGEFYIVGGCVFLHSCKCCWALPWDAAKLLGYSLLHGTSEAFSLGLIFPLYWGDTIPYASWCTTFSTLAAGNMKCFQHCVSSEDCAFCFFRGRGGLSLTCGDPLQISGALSLCSSPGLVFCPAKNSVTLLASPDPELLSAALDVLSRW